MTMVWGLAFIVDVAIGAALIFLLSVREYLLVGPIEGYVFMGALVLWTFWYAKRSKRRNQAIRAARGGMTSPSEVSGWRCQTNVAGGAGG